MESFELLPDSIVEHILSFLENAHKVTFFLTCKRFYVLYGNKEQFKSKKIVEECLPQHLSISVLEDPSVTGIKETTVEQPLTAENNSQLESNNLSITLNTSNTQEQTQPNGATHVLSINYSSNTATTSPSPSISPEEFVEKYAADMNSKKLSVMYAYDIIEAFTEKKIPLKLLGLLRSKLDEPRARTLVLTAVICIIAKDELINKLKKCIERINQQTASPPSIPVPTKKGGKSITINVTNYSSTNKPNVGLDVITPQQVIVDTLNLMLGLSAYSEECYNTELKRVILASFPRCLNERECEKSLYKKLNIAMFFQLLYCICKFTQLDFTSEAKTRLLLGFDTHTGYHSSNSLPSVGPSSPSVSPKTRHSGSHMDLMESISKSSPSSSYSSTNSGSSGTHTPPQTHYRAYLLEPRDISTGLGNFLEKCKLGLPLVHSENMMQTPESQTHTSHPQFNASRSINIGNPSPSRPAEVELQTDWIAVDTVPSPKTQTQQSKQPKPSTSPVAEIASTFKWYKKKVEVSISKLAQKK